MEDTEILCEYVNIQTRIRSAAVAATTILAGVTESDIARVIKGMQSICEGKELQGLKVDIVLDIQLIKLIRQLEEVAERIMGREE